MVTTQPASKRPICPLCSKPVRLCLCTRIQNPGLHNSVSVTILQHSLEKNHPLNSARIARLGLKNISVVTVYDVNFESRFVIRSPGPVSQMGSVRNGLKSSGFDYVVESRETQKLDFEYCDEVSAGKGNMDFVEKEHEFSIEEFTDGRNVDGQCNFDEGSATTALPAVSRVSGVVHGFGEEGFVAQKLQKPLKGSVELDECVEFEVEVPPGSVLLFPSEEAVSADDLEAMNVKVNNLIVLDGTWAKAKRMHGENPWLKLLPHFKLNLDKMSLHSEVRLQPKPDFCPPLRALFMP
ncbi:uncharacterized protein [Pyrus communis]|uniref:uncharacterized protein n=1 Tax=Pyrus communis TaxID=23211 RepID=UPI0035BF53C3